MTLNLTSDELLMTTRAVRKRLDLTRPVEKKVIEECIEIALQAPSGSNAQRWHFVVVTDAKLKDEIGKLYRKGAKEYFSSGTGKSTSSDDPRYRAIARMRDSALYLVEHIHEVPVMVIPCYAGRSDGLSSAEQAGIWYSIVPAAWSFALAARSRGLGTAITTFHLAFEKDAAQLLKIPYEKIMQTALIPLAYTKGIKFKPALRNPSSSAIHWNHW
ncbi:MAG: nitroreductase family protein [Thaumarchaeota archaeon]|nr:nitroreductase family protein [Nitrososphaerota archaeon]